MNNQYTTIISTISRLNEQYLYSTLDSFKANTSDIINTPILMVGNADVNYLECLKYNPKDICLMQDELWNLVKDKGKCEKFNLNVYRCLKYYTGNLLYLEDDITFQPNWDQTLKELLSLIKEEDFVLSIYTPYNLSHSKQPFVRFDRGFYGTQGVYFTAKVKTAFASFVMEQGILNYRHMADLLLQEFCNEHSIPLYVTTKSLVQHIGVESSIHSNNFHQAG